MYFQEIPNFFLFTLKLILLKVKMVMFSLLYTLFLWYKFNVCMFKEFCCNGLVIFSRKWLTLKLHIGQGWNFGHVHFPLISSMFEVFNYCETNKLCAVSFISQNWSSMDNFKKLEVTTKQHMEIKYVTLYYLCGITMA